MSPKPQAAKAAPKAKPAARAEPATKAKPAAKAPPAAKAQPANAAKAAKVAKASKVAKPPARGKAPAPAPATAAELLKHLKPTRYDEARVDAPTPLKGKAAKAASRKPASVQFAARRDAPLPLEQNASKMLRTLRDEHKEFHHAEAKGVFDGSKFAEFFDAEIETEVARPAEIVHDRIARWRCQCCDALIPVPRRTTVYHGDYVLEHDDVLGLLVNGERWVPKAETPLEVVQPGRLKDPFTGELIKTGKRSV